MFNSTTIGSKALLVFFIAFTKTALAENYGNTDEQLSLTEGVFGETSVTADLSYLSTFNASPGRTDKDDESEEAKDYRGNGLKFSVSYDFLYNIYFVHFYTAPFLSYTQFKTRHYWLSDDNQPSIFDDFSVSSFGYGLSAGIGFGGYNGYFRLGASYSNSLISSGSIEGENSTGEQQKKSYKDSDLKNLALNLYFSGKATDYLYINIGLDINAFVFEAPCIPGSDYVGCKYGASALGFTLGTRYLL